MPTYTPAAQIQLLNPKAPEAFVKTVFSNVKSEEARQWVRSNVIRWLRKQPEAATILGPAALANLVDPPVWLAKARQDPDAVIAAFAPSAELVQRLTRVRDILRIIERTAASKEELDGFRARAGDALRSLTRTSVEQLEQMHDTFIAQLNTRTSTMTRRAGGRVPDTNHPERVTLADGHFWLPLPEDWLRTAGQRLKNCLAQGMYADGVRRNTEQVWGLFMPSGDGVDPSDYGRLDAHLIAAGRFSRSSKENP